MRCWDAAAAYSRRPLSTARTNMCGRRPFLRACVPMRSWSDAGAADALQLTTVTGHVLSVYCVDLDPTSSRFVTVCSLTRWGVRAREAAAYSARALLRGQGSDDGLVKVWSLSTGHLIYTLRAHTVRGTGTGTGAGGGAGMGAATDARRGRTVLVERHFGCQDQSGRAAASNSVVGRHRACLGTRHRPPRCSAPRPPGPPTP
jgi:hypothetical protein